MILLCPLPLGEGWGEGLSGPPSEQCTCAEDALVERTHRAQTLVIKRGRKPSSPTLLPAGEGSKLKKANPMKVRTSFCFAAIIFLAPNCLAQQRSRASLANEVRREFLHAWNDYKQYAWGHDDLKPLSKSYHDWYAEPLLMTPVDALDTMILMGLKDEANTTREYVATHLSFDKDISVQNFEITIRLLGGLLSVYEMTGDQRLLKLAEDLGNRLLPVFNSPTGLPYRYVNLKTGAVRGNITNPAEAGTLLIEFGTLARLTHRQVFYDKAKTRPGGNLQSPFADRPGGNVDQCRDREMDRHRQSHQRRDRQLL